MKRTFLSLLLLIAGNGLTVTQAHAGFFDTLKKQVSKYAFHLDTPAKSAICLGTGLFCLGLIFPATLDLIEAIHERNSRDKSAIQDPVKEDYKGYAADSYRVKQIGKFISAALALGIPLTSLGLYSLLNNKYS